MLMPEITGIRKRGVLVLGSNMASIHPQASLIESAVNVARAPRCLFLWQESAPSDDVRCELATRVEWHGYARSIEQFCKFGCK